MLESRDVVVVGGAGRVGLPLGLAFADRGLDVVLFDLNADAVTAGGPGGRTGCLRSRRP